MLNHFTVGYKNCEYPDTESSTGIEFTLVGGLFNRIDNHFMVDNCGCGVYSTCANNTMFYDKITSKYHVIQTSNSSEYDLGKLVTLTSTITKVKYNHSISSCTSSTISCKAGNYVTLDSHNVVSCTGSAVVNFGGSTYSTYVIDTTAIYVINSNASSSGSSSVVEYSINTIESNLSTGTPFSATSGTYYYMSLSNGTYVSCSRELSPTAPLENIVSARYTSVDSITVFTREGYGQTACIESGFISNGVVVGGTTTSTSSVGAIELVDVISEEANQFDTSSVLKVPCFTNTLIYVSGSTETSNITNIVNRKISLYDPDSIDVFLTKINTSGTEISSVIPKSLTRANKVINFGKL